MGKITSISLGYQFIQSEVQSGRYGSASEVIRAALCLLEKEEKKLTGLRNALVLGERSGFVKDFDPKEHLKVLQTSITNEI